MLSAEDKAEIKELFFEGTHEVLDQVVLPRFQDLEDSLNEIKEDVSGLKEDVSCLKDDVRGLKISVENLENDMSGVKMRLTSMENKMVDNKDTYLVVKDHERRIKKLEKAVV